MTGAPVHDPPADHLLTPEDAAVLLTDRYWCYVDQLVFESEGASPAPSQP